MASVVIRNQWFSRPNVGMLNVVPTSGVGPPQKSEATFLGQLASAWFGPGTRTTQAAGAVTVGNVVSSTPPGGTTQRAGLPIAYVVAV